ncbi:MAG: nicotinate-nucleotide adenylyltransferase [Acidobacteria bacterium]|jgi:nicotinate-nucleotide adenylyltransferase|nr:nicotinate-nucleotide adenylyltransferase [Acidobacteriota bacterium]
MNIAIFGGTFDPIHCGHLAAAEAARDWFGLDRVCFVPAGHPPHRPGERLTAFEHRYAMVALACAGEPAFVPSLAEAPSDQAPNYSITTVRRFRRRLKPGDRLFFLIGADAFLELRTWHQWRALLTAAEFIIVSRPGFPLELVAQVFPAGMLRWHRAAEAGARRGVPPLQVEEFRLRGGGAWVLAGVSEPVSATDIRLRARRRQSLAGLVPEAVAVYIAQQHLYGRAAAGFRVPCPSRQARGMKEE